MSFGKRVLSFCALLLVLLCCYPMTAAAEDLPTGSIQVDLVHAGEPVSGGSLTLYRVGELNAEGTGFVLCSCFVDSGVVLNEVSDPDKAAALAVYVAQQSIEGITLQNDGSVCFEGLPAGLYLIVQQESAENFEPICPFLISIPMAVNGTYTFAVNASPKVDLQPMETMETTETADIVPSLPQTGQLKWPIPVLALAGTVLLAFGLLCCAKRKRDDHET